MFSFIRKSYISGKVIIGGHPVVPCGYFSDVNVPQEHIRLLGGAERTRRKN